MITRIRQYITRAFEDVPRTKKSVEMQEELISNLIEKYNDQLAQNKSEEEAYNTVIAGIGDLSELTESLRERHVLSSETPEERKRTARNTAFAVMLFILSPMALIVSAEVLKQDIEAGDVSVLDEILMQCPNTLLINSLPEEEWKNFLVS